uniref:Fibrinogen C domain containing 1 n=1 Tax=Marmota marmota marmota TaxID=9994 RepID=A0A8C5ZI65_MARMA
MVNDRWKTMGGASQLEERPRDKPQRPSCGYVLCTVLLSLAVLLAVAVTSAVLFLNHVHAPGTAPPPIFSKPGLRGRWQRPVGQVLDPSPTPQNLAQEQASGVLRQGPPRPSELGSGLASWGPRAGHISPGWFFSTVKWVSPRALQLLSESQGHLAHLVNSVSDVLDALQRDRGLSRPRVKADLQRAPSRGARPRGCANGSRPRDCLDVLLSGQQDDGVYSVFPTHYPAGFQVYCDMRTDGGGWTVFQRREDGSVNFFRGWEAYREGFGQLTGEHWLGLKRIHALTTQAAYELHVDLEDFDNGTAYARYGSFGVGLFSVDPEEDGYPLTVADYSGTAGDSLLKHSGMRFTTKDRDSDHSENNCAAFYRGAWWYRNCHTSNLNGQYLRGAHASYADGVEWSSWTGWQYSLKFSEMKIRPVREDH